ncbi:hypothetical protein [Tateyamaria omphalii]|uniref:Uncharacterized protein n=1 Tax=Tateyamaria omphalii TaxID=299262 RepID=A0A1P8MRS4_9RHOB|nr:hypothetical protein [Tateyamaria omphalii]APX10777.1 hypothetical protein BWR18_03005 [Tateyamaria omphalii]
METQESIQTRADRVQAALHAAFGVGGKTLDASLRKTGRRLPRRLHKDAHKIVDAQGFGGHPKLMRQVDGAALAAAEDRVVTYLKGIDRADRRKGFWLGIAGVVAFNILLVVAGVVFWMWWAGHV